MPRLGDTQILLILTAKRRGSGSYATVVVTTTQIDVSEVTCRYYNDGCCFFHAEVSVSLLIAALVDRAIALVKRREEVDRSAYSDFVVPLIVAFEAVHDDYLRAFRRYQELLATTSTEYDNDHPLIVAVEQDALFSDSLRAKVRNMPSVGCIDTLVPLLRTIEDYLKAAVETDPKYGNDQNFWLASNELRFAFAHGLCNIRWPYDTDEEKRWHAGKLLCGMVAGLQMRYRDVQLAHAELKKKLLEPR